ncbi:hypothetical protein TNCV_2813511 [Trichonephila clavipes]|nr:hypothetical protein TNCV_2813511 [Trichonephila clavipes]
MEISHETRRYWKEVYYESNLPLTTGQLLDLLRKRGFLHGTIYKYVTYEEVLRHILAPAGGSTSHLRINVKSSGSGPVETSGALVTLYF